MEELEEFDCCCEEGLGFEVARKDRREDIAGANLYQQMIMVELYLVPSMTLSNLHTLGPRKSAPALTRSLSLACEQGALGSFEGFPSGVRGGPCSEVPVERESRCWGIVDS